MDANRQKMLMRLLNNPGQLTAEEFNEEDQAPDEAESPEEDKLEETIGEEPELDPESPEATDEDCEYTDEMDDESSDKESQADPKMMEMMKRLKAGKSMEDDSSEQDHKEVANDMEAPMELRKKAMQMIKQKYLGQ